jgi:outer membrane protein OmpA-like peptidoglycan-associated protein
MSRSATKRLQQLNADKARPDTGGPPSFGASGRDDQLVSRFAFLAGSIMIFLMIAAAATFFGTNAIQGDLEARSEYQLRVAGYQNITAEVSGFDVTLQGFHHESRTTEDAVAAVSGVVGIGSVDATAVFVVDVNDIEQVAITGRPITIAWSNGVVTISGDVSSEGIQSYVANEPSTFVNSDELVIFRSVDATDLVIVEDLAVVERLTEEADWIGDVMALLRSLALGLDEGAIVVNPSGRVVITSGEVETRQEKRDVTEAAEEATVALEGDGFVVTPGIILPPDVFVATEEQVVELQATLTELIGDKVVEFELNSAELTDEGRALLDDILLSLNELPNVPIEIAGHADASGTAAHNLELSQQRAQAVADYFVAKGEDPARFIVEGYGDTRPIPGATAEQNRRIEFIPLEG